MTYHTTNTKRRALVAYGVVWRANWVVSLSRPFIASSSSSPFVYNYKYKFSYKSNYSTLHPMQLDLRRSHVSLDANRHVAGLCKSWIPAEYVCQV